MWVASATEADVDAYVRASERSRRRLLAWNPVDPYGLPSLIRAASRFHRTLLVHTRTPDGDHDLVGKVNVTNVVLGRALMGTLGYDAFDPYAGRGLFAEGLRLVVDLAFERAPHGMGLQRLEANVQPGNVRSGAVLRALGFRHEGFSPAYLLLPGPTGRDEWRDHDRYAVTAGEWPAPGYASPRRPRVAAVVSGLPGAARTDLCRRLAQELGVPCFADRPGTSDVVWSLLSDSPAGGVVVVGPVPERHGLAEGLSRAGFEPARVPVLDVDPSHKVGDRDVVGLALRVKAAFAGP
ncbi:MAG: GNAT family N-acetyltransferase [Lapillicoccus sp.]